MERYYYDNTETAVQDQIRCINREQKVLLAGLLFLALQCGLKLGFQLTLDHAVVWFDCVAEIEQAAGCSLDSSAAALIEFG